LLAAVAGQVTGVFGGVMGWKGLAEREVLPTPPPTGRMPDAAPNEAENVEQPMTIVTHRRLEVNPKASAAWMRRLSGHALLAVRSVVCSPHPKHHHP